MSQTDFLLAVKSPALDRLRRAELTEVQTKLHILRNSFPRSSQGKGKIPEHAEDVYKTLEELVDRSLCLLEQPRQYVQVQTHLRTLEKSLTARITRTTQEIPLAAQDACKALEGILDDPWQLLDELEEEFEPEEALSPLKPKPVGDEELRCLAQQGLAKALWDESVELEQVVWAFTRPIGVRRLVIAKRDVELASLPTISLLTTEDEGLPESSRAKAESELPAAEEAPQVVEDVPSRELPPQPRSRRANRLLRLGLVLQLSLAAGLLLTVSLLIRSQVHARQQEKEEKELQNQLYNADLRIHDYHNKLQYQQVKNQNLESAVSTVATSRDLFRARFDMLRRFSLQTYEGQPVRLSLLFSPVIGPPYYVGLQVSWTEESDPELIYYAGHKSLEQVLTHDFSQQLPSVAERRVIVTLRFHATGEAMETLKVGPVIEEKIFLILSQQGVRIASTEDADLVAPTILQPTNGQEVEEHFLLELGLRRPIQKQPVQKQRGQSNRVVRVLVRPLDGYQKWQEQYYVVPFCQRVEELPEREQRYPIWISLRAVLDTVPVGEKLPARFEVLIVDSSLELPDWKIGRNLMNFDHPDMAATVRARLEITLKPEKAEE
jgi:hypothetical protein